MIRRTAAGVFILFFVATSLHIAAAQDASRWKPYRSSEYGFETTYPPDWEFDDGYQNNYGKPPSTGQRPAYAGETRNLFGLEMDGPGQSHEGGGSFDDGAIIPGRGCTIAPFEKDVKSFLQDYRFDGKNLRLKSKGSYVCDMKAMKIPDQTFTWDIDLTIPVYEKK